RQVRDAVDDTDHELTALRRAMRDKDEALSTLQAERQSLRVEIETLRRSAEAKDKLIASLNYHLIALQRTIGWKILERLRRLRDRLLPADTRRRDLYWRVRRPVEVLLDEGLRAFFRKTRYKVRLKWRGQEFLIKAPPPEVPRDLERQYQLWIE